jgi:hypothetical protein
VVLLLLPLSLMAENNAVTNQWRENQRRVLVVAALVTAMAAAVAVMDDRDRQWQWQG